ncbi:VRR-NUC domain-containing protein [Mesorhizobium sp. M0293]|uniref:VRR-NUC domain-containing protein n=1 Tax=Mesorhizobium sp. M0293 TaxID=2956930 RepID=UPI00333B36D3
MKHQPARPGVRKGRTALVLPLEVKTHVAVADALRIGAVAGWLWSHFPAGERRDERTGARLKRMGLKKGGSDFLLISPTGQHHWLELKRGGSPLTKEQEDFRDECLSRNVPWAVARSFDEAIHQLTEWGAIRLSVAA